MKRALAVLLAAPLLLTACSSESVTQPNADTEIATETTDHDPDSWETLADMQDSLIAITGECETVENDGNTGYCYNQDTLMTYGLGSFNARSVGNAAINPDSGAEGYVVGDKEWSVFCAVRAGEPVDHPDEICTQIYNSIPGAEWLSVVREGKISTVETSTETTPTEPVTTFSDGIHMIGTDIQPGTYRNEGNDTCYWARMSGVGGTFDELIANGNPRGQSYVEVSADDVAFKSQLCGTWELVE